METIAAIRAAFFTELRHTPWGAAINYDGCGSKPVREFVIHNALYWLEEFNLDGLRFDAAHAIIDEGAKHLLDELVERAHALAGRPIHLLLENEENDACRLVRQGCAPAHYTAQWNDDLHHVLHVAPPMSAPAITPITKAGQTFSPRHWPRVSLIRSDDVLSRFAARDAVRVLPPRIRCLHPES